jgi:hypothetical protein
MMSASRAVLAVPLLLLATVASAAADPIEVHLRAKGAVSAQITLASRLDDTHHCALLGGNDEPQIYVLSINKGPSDTLLDPAHPGFSLTAAGDPGETWTETAPTAVVQVVIGGRRFIGFHTIDPEFRMRVSVRQDGAVGSFRAMHLVDETGNDAIDLEGTWRCAAAKAAEAYPMTPKRAALVTNEAEPRAVTDPAPNLPLPPEPVPESRRASHFRIVKVTCAKEPCSKWHVTNLKTKKKFHANVDLASLRLAPSIADAANTAEVELLVTGEETVKVVKGKRHTTIHAEHLDGVMPHS